VQPGGLTQSWQYDEHGQLTQATDGDGNVTSYSYVYGAYNETLGGGNGDLVEMVNPDGSTEQYTAETRDFP
jgi:YD repeat-containing protein